VARLINDILQQNIAVLIPANAPAQHGTWLSTCLRLVQEIFPRPLLSNTHCKDLNISLGMKLCWTDIGLVLDHLIGARRWRYRQPSGWISPALKRTNAIFGTLPIPKPAATFQ